LTRQEGHFSAHLVPAAQLKEALERPTLRAESVLDGIFAQAVIVVEADADRLVYQSVWETLQGDFRVDVHFATVGGTGGIADTCGLYRTLRIPIAVIADLDVLVNLERLSKVLLQLVDDQDIRDALISECKDVAEKIRALPPTLTPAEVQVTLRELVAAPMNWDSRDDVALRKQIGRLANDIDRMRRLKTGGVEAYEGSLKAQMEMLLTRLSQHGLFLVPRGELEQWLAGRDVQVSVSDKRAWANAAAQCVQSCGRQTGDVWEFVERVARFLVS
jgi:hypothetical protein